MICQMKKTQNILVQKTALIKNAAVFASVWKEMGVRHSERERERNTETKILQ